MSATIIDGNKLSQSIRAGLEAEVDALKDRGVTPGLAVVIVGDDPASHVYVRNKVKACAAVGIHSELYSLPAATAQAELLAKVHALNENAAIHGILVQLPVPKHIDNKAIIEAIAAEKDVDGFHHSNLGALVVGQPTFQPCTPYGVMKMLDHHKIPIEGQHAVVIGRSNIVGKPMALMLINRGATVTVCTSKTRELGGITRQADILIVATGKANMVDAAMVKDGAVVIDVGINRLPDGKLAGDVDFASVREKASYITPVPGGVGPMTITMLLTNTLESAQRMLSAKR
ncbi:MAG: bifunctional methylenetetrahydrofolate dehydrogenase/methenyltetrahydrofolate cyclohydrolase FolD [Burkholderiales bacterium]